MSARESDSKERLKALEAQMNDPAFWENKDEAQEKVREYNALKAQAAEEGKYEKGSAIVTIFSGAGGDDAEDFAAMLYRMYVKYCEKQGWTITVLHQNENDHGGLRNITFEVGGKGSGAYGTLKNESGVHRLVRISPFSAKKQRHTSFAMVEVIPKLPKEADIEIPEAELRFEFSRSGGAGGQNVNKRETAVRVVHIPTDIAVHIDSERTQMQNRERALEILKGKLFKQKEAERRAEERDMKVSATTDAEWGSQIRSYVLHPYQMVKDHRTNVEVGNVSAVLEEGELAPFIEAEQSLT